MNKTTRKHLLPLCMIAALLLTSCGSSKNTQTSSADPPVTTSGANSVETVNDPTTELTGTPTVTTQPDSSQTNVVETGTPVPTPDAASSGEDDTGVSPPSPDQAGSEEPTTVPTEALSAETTVGAATEDLTSTPTPTVSASSSKGSRDNTPVCYTPSAPGTVVYSTETSLLDISNASQGYVCASYFGTCPKVKFQITGPDGVTYTYNLTGGNEFFPLSAKSGTYTFGIYENITGTSYSVNMVQTLDIAISSQFGPFLYPNQYCMFNANSAAVKKASELAYTANNDLDVVSNIYHYVIQNISYDYTKAANITSGYVCNVDATLASGTGICLDYAAVMTCMLRSQGIPTRLEVGYAGSAYHAWISTYITDVGWVSGIIEFDGASWSLMDPTFAANSSADELKNFIGNGSNYTLKYMY